MPKSKKKFINKKKAVTFQLVNRSLQDPMSVDVDAPQQVLKPILKETAEERANRIDEQHKYGIYFTDDTNYLEFLKERSDNRMEWPETAEKQIEEYRKRFQLPSEVFASSTEENVGMLNNAASGEESLAEVDPDVLAALEDDFNFDDPDNQLEDDFIELADAFDTDFVEKDNDKKKRNIKFEDEDSDTDTISDDGSYDTDTLNGDDDEYFEESQNDERCQSSISYSNDPKEAYQQMLSKQFDRMLTIYDEASRQLYEEDEYEEGKGPDAPTEEEINMFEEDLNERRQTFQLDRDEEVVAKTKELAKRKNAFKTTYVEFEVKEKPADCQSRISTNTQYRPTVVEIPKKPRKIEVSKKTGMPINVLGNNNKLTLAALKQHNKYEDLKEQGPRSVYTSVSALSFRDKNESLEEKRQRKQELKNYRRERRMEKKQNKLAYEEERQRVKKCQVASRGLLHGF